MRSRRKNGWGFRVRGERNAPGVRALACIHEAGRAVAATALRGPEAVEWTAVLPSRRLAGRLDVSARRPYGWTELSIPSILCPALHALQARDDAVIALAGAQAKNEFASTDHHRPTPEDEATVDRVVSAFCSADSGERQAFRRWIFHRTNLVLWSYWDAVRAVAESLDHRHELIGREVAAEVAAARLAEPR